MPELYPTNLLHVWDEVGLPIMVLLGLFPYFLLTLLGRWRNVIASSNLATLVFWLVYNALDKAPTITYGTYFDQRLRSTNVTADPNLVLTVFWFPFVLLHNGFPDTVTSYSLADNETWKRYLAILFMKISIFIDYVLKFWDGSLLCYLCLIIFVIGGLNCLERACVQRSASKAIFRNYVHDKRPKKNPNLGPSTLPVDKYMDTCVNIPVDQPQQALLFCMSEQKLAGLSLNPQDIEISKSYFQQTPSDAAFQETSWVIQSMYDFFCTKAFVFRCPLLKLGHLIMCTVLLLASIIAFFDIQRADYATKYKAVTYVLIILTCISKVYGVFDMLGSSYMPYLLREKKTWLEAFPYKANSSRPHPVAEKTKIFISLQQFNLVEHCLLKKPTKCTGIPHINRLLIVLKTFCRRHSAVAPKQLLEEIHRQLVGRSTSARTTWLLAFNFPWNPEIELWKTIVCLHMVTTLCYFREEQPDSTKSRRDMSKLLSHYMLHVLRCWPVFMGNSFEGFEEVCDDVIEYFSDGNWPSSVSQACKAIVSRGGMVGVEEEKRLSIIYNAVLCYSQLYQSEAGVMWEAIFNGWTALLCFSAYKSPWIDHPEQLLDQVDLCSNQGDQRQGTTFMHQADKGCNLGEIQIESTVNDHADSGEGSSTRKFDELGKGRRNFGGEDEEASTRKSECVGIGDMLSDEGIMGKLEMDDEGNVKSLETLGMASEEDENDSAENFQAVITSSECLKQQSNFLGHTDKEPLDHLLQQEFPGEKIKDDISEQETPSTDN